MIHPDTELRFISDAVGYGVVATKLIPKGTITWVKDKLDRSFTERELNDFGKGYREILEKYCYRDNLGRYVLCWDIARYVNHSFNSSCLSTAYDFEMAVRDILPGEELTDDYGYLNVTEPFECLPEEGAERTMVMPDDLLRYHGVWDKKLLEVFPLLTAVNQPLRQFMEDDVYKKSAAIAEGSAKMDSILNCYFDPKRAGLPK